MLKPEEVQRDDWGMWLHSAVLAAPEETPWDKIPGVEGLTIVTVEFYDDAPETMHSVYEDTGKVTEWQPTPPEGEGWFLVGINDTEDGPCAWFARPEKDERRNDS